MSVTAGANLGLGSGYAAGDSGWGTQMNSNLRVLDTTVFLASRSAPINAPPGSPTVGDRYMVGSAPSGAWASNANSLAVWTVDETNTNLWQFMTPKDGWIAWLIPTDTGVAPTRYLFRNGTWAVFPQPLSFAGLTAITTATATMILVSGSNPDGSAGSGSMTVAQAVAAGVAAAATASSLSGTDSVLGVVAGVPKLVPAASLGGGGGGGGGSGGGATYAPGWGSFFSTGAWNRPAKSAMIQAGNTTSNVTVTEFTTTKQGPIQISNVSGDWAAVGVNPGSSPWTASMLIVVEGRADLADSFGVMVADRATGNFMPFYFIPVGEGAFPKLYIDHWNNLGSGAGYVAHPYERSLPFLQATVTLRIQYDGTNLIFSHSFDGLDDNSYVSDYQESLSSYLVATDFVGVGSLSSGAYTKSPVRLYGMSVTTP